MYQRLLFIAVFCIPMISVGDNYICNKSNEDLNFAYAWVKNVTQSGGAFTDPEYVDISRGWYRIQRGACKSIRKITGYNLGHLWVYATGDNGGVWRGPENSRKFCLHTNNGFHVEGGNAHYNLNSCYQSGGNSLKHFRSIKVNGTWSFTGGDGNAYVNLCNRTGETLYTSFGYYTKQGWFSRGWWKVFNGGCKKLNAGKFNGKAYVHANNSGATRKWGRDKNFCVNAVDPYKIQWADKVSCTGHNQEFRKFTKVNIKTGRTQTFNLN